MAKIDQMVLSLQKLYAKRSALDKQILNEEKKLTAEAKAAAKPVPAKKPAVQKPEAPKPAIRPLLKK